MTEEEARIKWCPRVQISADSGIFGSSNRGDGGSNFNCIASDCMMWVEVVSAAEAKAGNYPDDGHCGLTRG